MLDPIEEKKYADLKSLCREFKLPVTEMFIGIKLHDRNGVLIFDDYMRGHSWTRNWYNWITSAGLDMPSLGVSTFGAGFISSKNTAGTVYPGATLTAFYRTTNTLLGNGFHENTVNGLYGIFIGSGSTSFSVEDYNLAGKIAPGNAAGQCAYQAMTYPLVSYASKTWTELISRIFNNNSGGEISVNEIGLVWYGSLGSTNYFLFERSVLAVPTILVNGGQLTVTYTLSVDFSAID
jgi:hypothetical protein